MLSTHSSKYVRIFLVASIFWIALGTLHLSALASGDLETAKNYLSLERWVLFLSAYFSWAFLTTFVYWLIERSPPNRENWRWSLGFVLTMLTWLAIISLIVPFLSSVLWGYDSGTIWDMLGSVTPFLYLFNALKFIMTYGACAGIVYYRRLQDARLELLTLERVTAEVMEKKTRFELQALQAQLSPHFLFNALNSVSAMARNNDSAGIVSAVSHLADLLRYAVEATSQTEVMLDDELKFTAHYVALQKIRFGAGFDYEIDVQLLDSYCFCPPFCLQTLVENAFSHNELSWSHPLRIKVDIRQVDGDLIIKVENSLTAAVENAGTGVGLRNLRERLQLLYGGRAQLSAQLGVAAYCASITLPIRLEHD